MKTIDEIRIATHAKRIWLEIRFAYMMIWTIGWLFTLGYTSIQDTGVFKTIVLIALKFGLWPVFLGHELAAQL